MRSPALPDVSNCAFDDTLGRYPPIATAIVRGTSPKSCPAGGSVRGVDGRYGTGCGAPNAAMAYSESPWIE